MGFLLLRTRRQGPAVRRAARSCVVTYSHTQIAQYLRCPRSYRHRYLDGWRERYNRPALLFGRCFEQALAAFFARDDSGAALFNEWSKHQDTQLEYSRGDGWERTFRQGVQLL